jgi:hypothetical protein
MDPWFRRAPGLVTVLSSDLLLKVNLPKVNALSIFRNTRDKDRWQTADLFLADNELRGQQFGIRIGLAEAVLDARHSLMDPWFRRAPGLVTVLSSDLLLKVNLPYSHHGRSA